CKEHGYENSGPEEGIARFCSRNRGCVSCQVIDKRQLRKEESAGWRLGAGLWTAAPQRSPGYQDHFGRTVHFCCLRYGSLWITLYNSDGNGRREPSNGNKKSAPQGSAKERFFRNTLEPNAVRHRAPRQFRLSLARSRRKILRCAHAPAAKTRSPKCSPGRRQNARYPFGRSTRFVPRSARSPPRSLC